METLVWMWRVLVGPALLCAANMRAEDRSGADTAHDTTVSRTREQLTMGVGAGGQLHVARRTELSTMDLNESQQSEIPDSDWSLAGPCRVLESEQVSRVPESEGGGAAGLGLGHAALGGAAAGAPERAGTGAAGAPAGSAGRGCGGGGGRRCCGGAGRETAAERGEEGREECGELGGGPSAPSEEKGWAKLRSTARARKLSGREKYK